MLSQSRYVLVEVTLDVFDRDAKTCCSGSSPPLMGAEAMLLDKIDCTWNNTGELVDDRLPSSTARSGFFELLARCITGLLFP